MGGVLQKIRVEAHKAHRIVTDVAHDGQLSQLYLGLG